MLWRSRFRHFGMALVLVAAGSTALRGQADVIDLKKGANIVAKVWEETDTAVSFNVYRTAIRRVRFGTETVERKNVKSVIPDPDPHRRFWSRASALRGGTADEWAALGLEAKAAKRSGLARFAFVEALVLDGAQGGALRELGSDAKALLAADPRLNPALAAKLAAWLGLDDAVDRSAAAAEIAKLGGGGYPLHALERARRSAKQPKGRRDDVLLTLDAKAHPGAVYTILVPKSYDPWRPTPLVLGLHGGGAGGKDGTGVVGSGSSAMDFFQSEAERLGWVVVCPTALRAPWAHEANDAFLLAVLEEVQALYHVDRNRIYLAGHSMGGFGAWHYGSKYAHLWAAISPNAGGGRPDLRRLEETKTGVYCYHGADDTVVPPNSDREVAARLRESGQDFVYCEIPDSGHSWPDDVRAEMWEFFRVRRLAIAPNRAEKGRFVVTEEPASSFAEKASPREVAAFGPLGAAAAAEGAPDAKRLLADLVAGGGRAEKAAAEAGSLRDAAFATAIAKLLGDSKQTTDTRRFAARALGLMEQPSALKALRRASEDEELEVVHEACLALGRLRDPDAGKSFPAAARKLVERFGAKKTGHRIDFTDFEAHLDVAAALAEGVALTRDPKAAPALGIVGQAMLFDPIEVPTSARAGQNADAPRRRLATRLVDAAEALADPSLNPMLSTLAARPALGVAERARALLDAGGGG